MTNASPLQDGFRTSHPKALWILFFSELWERFSFYGMRALLVLYMISDAIKYDREYAFGIYGAYTSLVYLAPILGGFLADKVLGYRHAIVLGGTLMALGHFAMAIEHEVVFFGALALIAVGNGFFKPNISATVGRLYVPGDPMRDAGFSRFYIGINIGAFASPLACGFLGETLGWHYGFGAAGVGMVLGLLVFLKGQSLLEGKADPPDAARLRRYLLPIWGLAFAIVPIAGFLMQAPDIAKILVMAVAGLVLAYMVYLAVQHERVQRDRIFAYIILFCFNVIFWALFEQAGSSLTTYARDVTDRSIFGWSMPVTWTQSFNAFFIVTLAPLFTLIWTVSRRMRREPNIPAKFGLGVIQAGLGYAVLVAGAGLLGDNGLVPLVFLIGCYLVHTTGELCLSPVGLSAVTKLAPKAQVGLFMGAWFLSFSLGYAAAGQIAKATGNVEEFAITASLAEEKEPLKPEYTAFLAKLNTEIDTLSKELGISIELKNKVQIDAARSYEKRAVEIFQAAINAKLSNLLAGLRPDLSYSKDLLQIFDQSLEKSLKEEAGPLSFEPGAALDEAQLKAATDLVIKDVQKLQQKAIDGYNEVFWNLAIVAVIAGLLLTALSPLIGRLTHGIT